MSVRFTIRSADLRRLRTALHAFHHPEKGKQWIVFLEVTEWAAIFRFSDKAIQYPVDGKSPGFAKFAEEVFWRATGAAQSRKFPKEVAFVFQEGFLQCHEYSERDDIEVGYFRYPDSNEVFYISDAELVALRGQIDATSALGSRLRENILEASERIANLVNYAASTLWRCGVTQDELSQLVDSKLAELKPRVMARFDTLGLNLWKS